MCGCANVQMICGCFLMGELMSRIENEDVIGLRHAELVSASHVLGNQHAGDLVGGA